jgi:hypothetical protein
VLAWQTAAEGGEVVGDLGDGLEPTRVVDREEFGEVGWFDIEARGVERFRGGEVADGGSLLVSHLKIQL